MHKIKNKASANQTIESSVTGMSSTLSTNLVHAQGFMA